MEISIKDFPDRIYIKLNDDYKKEILDKLSKIKLNYLSKKLKISKTTIIEWKKRTDYFPLKKIKEILKIINKNNLKELNNNIIAYGTKKSNLYIKNPKIPIADSPSFREIVIHIMCDGCYNQENGYAAYYNFPKETKKEFINELKECFGDINFKIHQDHVHFPTAIPLILKDYLKIDFNSKKCRVPLKFFKGNRKNLSAIIRAAIIDEGTVDGSNVRIDSCNEEFLEDLKNICKKLDYKCGKTWESKGPIFRFNILSKSINLLKEDLGNLPIQNKQELIKIANENQTRNWKYKLPGEIKGEILKSLILKPMGTTNLVLKIKVLKTAIGNHLRWLSKEGIISFETKNNKRIYFIKNKLKTKEFLSNPSKFIKCEKINNYGLSQLNVIKFLNQDNKRYSEIEKYTKFNKSANFKLISSLKNKGFIKKNLCGKWKTADKGKKILQLDEKKARYMLYANIK
ncbi:MAG: helix-turn-helix domain-containing protein [Nanoarchaeota archaeon]